MMKDIKGTTLDIPGDPFGFSSFEELMENVMDALGFEFDAEEKQLPIDESSRDVLSTVRINIFRDDVDAIAEQLFTGDISIGQWEESMKRMIREVHTSLAAIGKGGWDSMEPADWGRLGPVMKDQYRYLHGFAEHIMNNKDTISLEAIKARAHLYGNAAGYSAHLMEAGDIARMLPWMPKDGTTECLTGCKCLWISEIISREGDYNIVEFVWRLQPAEHCGDCLGRNGHRERLKLPITMNIPAMIGGY